MKNYRVTIGLEIHAELKTKTKMFSPSLNNPDEKEPNKNINPIDIAHPGTLPVINKKALEHMVNIGLAVGGEISNFTEFDRKNYFYPDIPKGYQISQYKYPIVSGGEVAGFELTRVHLEEDTGTLKHFDDYSLVDFNRAGIPLVELVTEPVLHTAEDVVKFAKEFQLILRYVGASDANIEKGEMRIEVNISLSPDEKLGTKVEIKNIGSISAAGKASEYEIKRQTEALENGEKIIQETRGWNDQKQITFSQRKKESAHDYRYFPEPDLPKLYIHEIFDLEKMKKELVELPKEKRKRYSNIGLEEEATEIFINDFKLANFFEEVIKDFDNNKNLIKKAVNFITSDITGLKKEMKDFEYPNPENFAKLIKMLLGGIINSRGAKDILSILIKENKDPQKIAEENNLIQESDKEAIKVFAQKILNENPESVNDYRNGKETLIKFFIGQIMKETKGSVNPELAIEIFKELLK